MRYGSTYTTTVSRSATVWATPLAFAVHNAEEAWAFPRFLTRVQAHLPDALSTVPISIAALETALAVVTAGFLAIAAWAAARPASAVARWAALLVPAIGVLNALAHTSSATFLLRGYSPGVLTAVCVVAPISVLVLRRAWREHWLSPREWGLLWVTAVMLHGPILIAVLFVASRI
jgi:hypothetical protein